MLDPECGLESSDAPDDADQRSQRERMLAGDPYVASDPELQQLSQRAMRLTEQYNRTSVDAPEERRRILSELLGSFGDGVEIRPPFFLRLRLADSNRRPHLRQLQPRRARRGDQ